MESEAVDLVKDFKTGDNISNMNIITINVFNLRKFLDLS